MAGFAGFDAADYPGDGVMAWLKAHTNLVWCGYYLGPAPSHGDTSWMGTRAAITALGMGIAPIYVGQQVTGPGSKSPSLAQGTTDGGEAADLMTSEAFTPGSCVYLDLENGPPLTQPLRDYVAGWYDAVSARGFQPGVYCSHAFADQIHQLRSGARIWAFKVSTVTPHPVPGTNFPTSDPAGCGYTGAFAWQLGQNCQLTVPGAPQGTLLADLDVAVTSDPGAPNPQLPIVGA
ncbi:MAG TPA: glycoside hydrolase domain-containing protein [Stellaceae bacterium]|nr:glycoside hydrolase domain-containing protein [Stellaceae bacterium]